MLIMARDRDYPALLTALRGKTVLIWTCNVCARLCGLGGREAAERLAARLTADGVAVAGVYVTSASCLTEKVVRDCPAPAAVPADVVLALTCNVGARLVAEARGQAVLNPVVTLGYGYLDGERGQVLCEPGPDGTLTERPAAAARAARGLADGPFV